MSYTKKEIERMVNDVRELKVKLWEADLYIKKAEKMLREKPSLELKCQYNDLKFWTEKLTWVFEKH